MSDAAKRGTDPDWQEDSIPGLDDLHLDAAPKFKTKAEEAQWWLQEWNRIGIGVQQ